MAVARIHATHTFHRGQHTPHGHVQSSRDRFYAFGRPGRCRRPPIRRQNGGRGTRRHRYLGAHPSPTRRHLITPIHIITRGNRRISGPRRRRTGASRRKKTFTRARPSLERHCVVMERSRETPDLAITLCIPNIACAPSVAPHGGENPRRNRGPKSGARPKQSLGIPIYKKKAFG